MQFLSTNLYTNKLISSYFFQQIYEISPPSLMEATKSLSRSRLHSIPSFRSESDAEILLTNEKFRFQGLADEEDHVAREEAGETNGLLRISVHRRETLKRTKRDSLQSSKSLGKTASVNGRVCRGHQRSLSDTACGGGRGSLQTNMTTSSTKSSFGSHHSPRKIPRPKEMLTKPSNSSSLAMPEAYVIHRPLAEGFLDMRNLRLGDQPLSVTVPLQTNW